MCYEVFKLKWVKIRVNEKIFNYDVNINELM